jgi:hypothetical protein
MMIIMKKVRKGEKVVVQKAWEEEGREEDEEKEWVEKEEAAETDKSEQDKGERAERRVGWVTWQSTFI